MKHEIEIFKSYLFNEGRTERSVIEHLNNLKHFDRWCNDMGIHEKEFLTRGGILEYVSFMKEIPIKASTQNIRLNSLQKYYECLKTKRVILKNPVRGLRIRNEKKRVVHNPLNSEQILTLYNDYVTYLSTKIRTQRKPLTKAINLKRQLIMSLVMFQGLHTGELDRLTIHDINLSDGTMYISSTSRGNSRVIDLHKNQIIPFYEYLHHSDREQNEKLFNMRIQKSFNSMFAEVRGINPIVQNLQHIRASVLMNWIKQYGKRKAQYMIGHKFVSTTQSYEIQDISELSELMEKTHLFG